MSSILYSIKVKVTETVVCIRKITNFSISVDSTTPFIRARFGPVCFLIAFRFREDPLKSALFEKCVSQTFSQNIAITFDRLCKIFVAAIRLLGPKVATSSLSCVLLDLSFPSCLFSHSWQRPNVLIVGDTMREELY